MNPWNLSDRQVEVMDALCKTGTDKGAARELGLVVKTIETHSTIARAKMQAPNRTLAILAWDRFNRAGGSQ